MAGCLSGGMLMYEGCVKGVSHMRIRKFIPMVCVLFIVGLTQSSYAAGAISLSYCGQWHFDEGSGTIAYDCSGEGHDGTISGATWSTDSRAGAAALLFEGISPAVVIDDLDLPGNMTVWASVKVNGPGLGHGQAIVSKWNPGYGGNYELGLDPLLRPYFEVAFAGSGEGPLAPAPLTPGVWYDLMGTYDGTTIRICIDGKQVASYPQVGTVDQNDLITTIGSSASYGAEPTLRPFNGIIDEVAIANWAGAIFRRCAD